MIRLCLVLLLTATIARADELSSLLESNGTEAYFLSPNGLGKTDEVSKALAITQQHIKIATTEYNHTSTYTLTNVSIGCAYNDAKQTSKVTHDEVLIKGGRVEFTYQFNFTRKDPNGTVIQGSGFGT